MADETLGGTAQRQLRSIVERLERLEADKKAISGDLSEVYAEAKGNGFDAKILRKVIRWRAQDRNKRQEEEALLDLYLAALGEIDGGTVRREKPAPEPELPLQPEKPAPPLDSVATAKTRGEKAGKDGDAITTNPYPAGTKQRAAWDEAWCKATGSDGMDPDPAWKPEGGSPAGDEAAS